MARETIFIVQAFSGKPGALKPEPPTPALNTADARMGAAIASAMFTGVVAYSRTGDVTLGEYDEPVILARFGTLPDVIVDYDREVARSDQQI